MKLKYTANQVAKWMLETIKQGDCVYQETVVYEIAKKFGNQFTYHNENGNLAIRKDVLATFRKLTKDSVVWNRGERYWRMRQRGDKSSRQQD